MPKMTPSEAFVETLVANNVTEIFGIMGSAFMDAMDIFVYEYVDSESALKG